MNVAMGKAKHLDKWESHAAMIRLVCEMQDRLDEAGLLSDADKLDVDNVVCTFARTLPAKVRDEVRHG